MGFIKKIAEHGCKTGFIHGLESNYSKETVKQVLKDMKSAGMDFSNPTHREQAINRASDIERNKK